MKMPAYHYKKIKLLDYLSTEFATYTCLMCVLNGHFGIKMWSICKISKIPNGGEERVEDENLL
jgi:hypothetical protein